MSRNNVHTLPERRLPIDDASEWVAKIDRGLSLQEQQTLRLWVASDARHRDALLEVAGLWDRMDALAQLSELFPNPPASRPSRQKWVYGLSFAASLALVVLVAFPFVAGRPVWTDAPAAHAVVYETAVGGLSTASLSDGSLLTLNTASRVRVDFDQHRRHIELEQGEIHIDVSPDPYRPLRVIAGNRIVEAVGTVFSVKLNESRSLEVLVAEGTVRISLSPPADDGTVSDAGESSQRALHGREISVVEGEHMLLDENGDVQEHVQSDDIDIRLSWRNGNLIFRGQTLADATLEVGRYTSVEFVFLDEDLKQTRVAGLFKAGDVSGFLESLKANFAIDHDRTGDNTIVLKARD